MGLGETITVINKSGKVVSSSKHIVGVWKEARAAYRERKAEIQAERNTAARERKLTDGVRALRIEDDVQSRASSHRSKHSRATHRSKSHRHSHGHDRPALERGYTDSFYANETSHHRFEQDLAGQTPRRQELVRRSTDMYYPASRSNRRDSIDMDLAYGDVPPPLLTKKYEDGELREKASKVAMLLDEANCLQHTVAATIENLQKNPEALAAVSLTLAEISAIVGKMGPGVLIALKSGFPAVAALLLSPQFMIAGGVAVGVTIVALGGYKIIKKIQAQKEEDGPIAMPGRTAPPPEESNHELDELEPQELSRVEMWRRGIADAEAMSAGTDVDGEFITPGASRQLVAAGVLDGNDLKSRRTAKSRKDSGEPRPKVHRAKSERSVKSSGTSATRRNKTAKGGDRSNSKKKEKEKEPLKLKMLFRSQTARV